MALDFAKAHTVGTQPEHDLVDAVQASLNLAIQTGGQPSHRGSDAARKRPFLLSLHFESCPSSEPRDSE